MSSDGLSAIMAERVRGSRPIAMPRDWESTPIDERADVFARMDAELDELGIVFVEEALSEETCDALLAVIDRELETATAIERSYLAKPNSARVLYDFQGRSEL